MNSILQGLVSAFSVFQGPIMGLLEKGIFAGVLWAFAKGGLDPQSAAGVAGELYLAISGTITAVTKTQTAHIQAVNSADNGVKVVAATVSAPIAEAPKV